MGYLARYAEQEGAILAGKMITEHNSYARPWAQPRGYNRERELNRFIPALSKLLLNGEKRHSPNNDLADW